MMQHNNIKGLLVDDAETILMIERMMLNKEYDLVTAKNGEEAIAVAMSEKPDLILLDVVMPKMGGRDMAVAIKSRYPTIKVLYVSGYAHDVAVGQDVLSLDVAFLQKPFTPVTLARKVRDMLNHQ